MVTAHGLHRSAGKLRGMISLCSVVSAIMVVVCLFISANLIELLAPGFTNNTKLGSFSATSRGFSYEEQQTRIRAEASWSDLETNLALLRSIAGTFTRFSLSFPFLEDIIDAANKFEASAIFASVTLAIQACFAGCLAQMISKGTQCLGGSRSTPPRQGDYSCLAIVAGLIIGVVSWAAGISVSSACTTFTRLFPDKGFETPLGTLKVSTPSRDVMDVAVILAVLASIGTILMVLLEAAALCVGPHSSAPAQFEVPGGSLGPMAPRFADMAAPLLVTQAQLPGATPVQVASSQAFASQNTAVMNPQVALQLLVQQPHLAAAILAQHPQLTGVWLAMNQHVAHTTQPSQSPAALAAPQGHNP